jgi:uncharacterized Fe-S cluster-containing radical SAM superfamily protein
MGIPVASTAGCISCTYSWEYLVQVQLVVSLEGTEEKYMYVVFMSKLHTNTGWQYRSKGSMKRKAGELRAGTVKCPRRKYRQQYSTVTQCVPTARIDGCRWSLRDK